MNPLRQKMVEDMQLRGLSEKTQDAYVRAVRQLAEHSGKSPDCISEEELRQYFLYLTNGKQVSPSTLTVALCGIKFFLSIFARHGSIGFRPKWSTPRGDASETPDERRADDSCLPKSRC